MPKELQEWVDQQEQRHKDEALNLLFRDHIPKLGDWRLRQSDGSLEIYTKDGWEMV
jgi:hypothetical protein